MHKEEGLSFSNVITFNLDEYYPMTKRITIAIIILHQHLFDHIDIKSENINIPDGTVASSALTHIALIMKSVLKMQVDLTFIRNRSNGSCRF
jgi:glucosamine-6-phosphate deaminase